MRFWFIKEKLQQAELKRVMNAKYDRNNATLQKKIIEYFYPTKMYYTLNDWNFQIHYQCLSSEIN